MTATIAVCGLLITTIVQLGMIFGVLLDIRAELRTQNTALEAVLTSRRSHE